VSAGHSVPQTANFEEEANYGRVMPHKTFTLTHAEGEHLQIKIPRGKSIDITIELHLWLHVSKQSTQMVKNVFKSKHIQQLETIAQSRSDAKQKAANDFASSLQSLSSSVAKAVPDPKISAGIAVSSDAINLFRNTVHYIQVLGADKLLQQRTIKAKAVRGWDGNYRLYDVQLVGDEKCQEQSVNISTKFTNGHYAVSTDLHVELKTNSI